MRRTQLLFFATRSDLEPVIRSIESIRSLKYVKAGLLSTRDPKIYLSAFDLPSFGRAVAGDAVQEAAYLVVDANEEVRVETIPQRRGGELYGVYPNQNPRSVTFRPCGTFDERHLIRSEVSTAGSNGDALNLFALFESEIRRAFRSVKGYRVGPAAEQALDAGVRLTPNIRMSPAYDLTR